MLNQESPITSAIYQDLTKPRAIVDPDTDKLPPLTSSHLYALGWECYWYRGHQVIIHDGMTSGFGSSHFFLPGLKFGCVILGNSSSVDAPGAAAVAGVLSREFIDEVLGVPKDERPDWNKFEEKSEAKDRDDEETPRKMLRSDLEVREPQEVPLEEYVGTYDNAGYHSLLVEIKDGALFVDAKDRSEGFTLTFEHVCEQTKYIAHLEHYLEGGDENIAAEFKFEGDNVVKMGLHLEDELKDLIWFDRISSTASTDVSLTEQKDAASRV